MFETRALGLGQDLGLLSVKIKRVIELRLFKTAGVFVGANRRTGLHNPIATFLEDLCIVRDLLRGGPLFWGHFSPERVRTAVEAHRSRSSSSIDNDMAASFEDTSLPAVYATGQSSGRGSLDPEDDGEPTVEDPVSGR
ncbi:hypothetical protein F2Q69_00029311 [Brassica cretica]|uniref:Uncharacterized protein n=1 Tax=Brassica cretica TaxID=69181 RepID=A0A8S9S677_BRACR|nr:hypothetical protein F2Q69_00029311 [Brassica cretica]